MIAPFAFALAASALVLGIGTLARADRFDSARGLVAAGVLETGLVVQAVLDGLGIASGHRPASPATHIAYLAVSVALIPAAAAQVQGRSGRWAGALLAITYLLVAVVVVRLQATWRPAHD
ncbi:hypothetical protein [Cellulomonas sp. HZM]|uniref:hypothetical protein n=1 Tax=Cellulomonas sp. HZM TaxID=1454010 RepID=UPI00068FAF6C|nr:hypothetical protein [Cellulomonas sp. HZM]